MSKDNHTVPCPKCGKQPELEQVGFERSRSYSSPSLYFFKYECRRFFRIWLCHAPKKPRCVAKGTGAWDWEDCAKGEWNDSVALYLEKKDK